ncbi:hypothetical protein FOL47_006823 [Perkinsus chesapeaki]|uniref:Uncharacterized protein n=1 Tax=Perkinsus chesapeaki TaxID=330153 RepID=A0A7J6MWT6_PERCH|nr:hypothetical protein FOL47_006823 [Perkinsus chesapeaki]
MKKLVGIPEGKSAFLAMKRSVNGFTFDSIEMIGRITMGLVMITTAIGKLIDSLPAQYCTRIDIPGKTCNIQTFHTVTFWNGTTMEYRQANSRRFLPWWQKRRLRNIIMVYNECADAPQPDVSKYDFEGFGFTKEQFAAMRHYEGNDTLELTIYDRVHYLERCPGPWDGKIRK